MSTLAFDPYAADYDRHFTFSPIGILQRKRVFRFLSPLLSAGKNVLEINCGTGEDALAIAAKVKSVLATDISPEMIRQGELKKEKKSADNLVFKVADIKTLHAHLNTTFDLLFSDFGGLNCLDAAELRAFAEQITPFITKEGQLVLVIMGRNCAWENVWFRKQKDARAGRRKAPGGADTLINGSHFKTYYYSPSEIAAMFAPHFRVRKVRPIGLFIPPSYLNSYFASRPGLLRVLSWLEKLAGSFAFLSDRADHYLIIFEKT